MSGCLGDDWGVQDTNPLPRLLVEMLSWLPLTLLGFRQRLVNVLGVSQGYDSFALFTSKRLTSTVAALLASEGLTLLI